LSIRAVFYDTIRFSVSTQHTAAGFVIPACRTAQADDPKRERPVWINTDIEMFQGGQTGGDYLVDYLL
jgi:hypothetical protein